MPQPEPVTASTSELLREFPRYSDIARSQPVVVTRDGRPCNVLISIEEYERLKQRDRHAFLSAETPDEFLVEIERLAGTDA